MEKFAKIKRIAALIGVILLAGMYIVVLIAAMGKWEKAHSVFMAALYATIVVPIIIYILQVIYKAADKRDKDQKKAQ